MFLYVQPCQCNFRQDFKSMIRKYVFHTSKKILNYRYSCIHLHRNTSVEMYYTYSNTTGENGYYYLNTFENIIVSSGRWNFFDIQWIPSCTRKNGLSSGVVSHRVEINIFSLRFILLSDLFKGRSLSSGWPLRRGSTVYHEESKN